MFTLERLAVRLLAALVALPLHEFAHAWMADRLGDPTARLQGRMTLNPKAHIDPVGFLLLLLTGFGWAKPVPVNPYNLRGRYDMAWVALAGPASHFLFVALALVIPPQIYHQGPWGPIFWRWVFIFTWLNVALAFFNLFPLPPLDGSRIVASFFPEIWERYFVPLLPYSTLLFILLLFLLPRLGINVLGLWVGIPGRMVISGVCAMQWLVFGTSLCSW